MVCLAATAALGVGVLILRSSQILVRIVAIAGLFWLILVFALTFGDHLAGNRGRSIRGQFQPGG